MGSKTYEHALALSKDLGWVIGDNPIIGLTSRMLQTDRQNIELDSGDLNQLVSERMKPKYKNVSIVGDSM